MRYSAVVVGFATILLARLSGPGLLASEQKATPTPIRGLQRVTFGKANTTKDPKTGGLHCAIPTPLPEPVVFEAGTTEMSYVIEVDANIVRDLSIELSGPGLTGQIQGTGCNEYGVCLGALCQKQYGKTVMRGDRKSFQPGQYKLQITAGERVMEIPFTVK